jgi:hypothetical protein
VELLDLEGRDSVPDQAWERRLWQPADLSWGTGTLALEVMLHSQYSCNNCTGRNGFYDTMSYKRVLQKLNKQIVFSKRKAV